MTGLESTRGERPAAWRFQTADVLTLAFVAGLGALAAVCAASVPRWPHVVLTCGSIAAVVCALARLRARWASGVVRFLHDWALAPIVYVLYLELHLVVGPIHGGEVIDQWLIRADLWLFGVEPTAWLGRLARPWTTETLQLAYTLFYVLILLVGAELWRRDARAFGLYAFACGCAFYLSFCGYLVAPAIGPRFSLYDAATVERELPGLWLTPYLRAFVDAGGLAPTGVPAALAPALAPRDAFPSGHTTVTLLLVWWAWRERARVRWFVTPAGTLLVVATVYLRYHYVIDVLAGLALGGLVIASASGLHALLERHLGLSTVSEPGRKGRAPNHDGDTETPRT